MLCTDRDSVLEEGLNIWHGEETARFKPKYDIILVHGLGSHPYWSWLHEPPTKLTTSSTSLLNDSAVYLLPSSSRRSRIRPAPEDGSNGADRAWSNDFSNTDALGRLGTFWPRDLLPLDVPDARIGTLGFKSQWSSSRFQTSFRECGEHLLTVLDQSRRSEEARRRPIIFIAHSFGGLVVQSALVSARMDDRYASICTSLAGCLFLGCPFGGSDGASYLNMATQLFANHQQILNSLRPGNRDLWILQHEFLRSYREVSIVCFYEKIKSGLGRPMLVVPEWSACIHGAKSVAFYKDHRGMNKFKSKDDETYAQLLSELQSMLRQTKSSGHRSRGVNDNHRRDSTAVRHRLKRLVDTVPTNLQASRFRQKSYKPSDRPDRSEDFDYAYDACGDDAPGLCDHEEANGMSRRPVANLSQATGLRRRPVPGFGTYSESAALLRSPTADNRPSGSQPRRERHNEYGLIAARTLYAPPTDVPQELDVSHSQPDATARLPHLPSHLAKTYRMLHDKMSSESSSNTKATMVFELQGDDHYGAQIVNTPTMTSVNKRKSKLVCSAPLQDLTLGKVERMASLRYVRHDANISQGNMEPAAILSRQHVLDNLLADGSKLMSYNRVALTGSLGIGKTYIASAFVERLSHQSRNTPIFWVTTDTVTQLQEDCKAITELMGLKPPEPNTKPWNWLCKIIRRLSNTIFGSWAMVLDGVALDGKDLGVRKLCETSEGKHGYILMTTRHLDIAEMFLSEAGVRIDVGALDPSYAANLLVEDASLPMSPIFDQLAKSLGFEPFAITNVKAFLKSERVSLTDYADRLMLILNADAWANGCQLCVAAQIIEQNRKASLPAAPQGSQSSDSALLLVLWSCINPAWYTLFDQLERDQPVATDLLSLLAVFGRRSIPNALLSTNAHITAAANVLLDYSILTSTANTIVANQLMLAAHRIWLMGRNRLAHAHKSALQLVACQYADAGFEGDASQSEALEPFAKFVLSSTTQSWLEADITCRWFRTMLLQKRSTFFRLSGTNELERQEMEEAEIGELEAIHGIDTTSGPLR